jgi:RNA recognition motif. (a.k.a. RRM, RBD, or RNP domain)
MATDHWNWREPAQEVPSDFSASSSPTPSVQGEDDEPTLETTKIGGSAINTIPAPSNPQFPPVEPNWVDLQAQDDRVRSDLNVRIKKILQARIPGVWFQNTSCAPKDKDVLLAAMRYLHSLRDRISGTKRAPASLVEIWSLGRIRGELQAIVPEILQKEARNNVEAQVKYTGTIQIMFAIDLYLDELEAAVSGLGEDSMQSSEPDESDEWNGISDGDETGEDAGQQQELEKELDSESDEAEGWHGTFGGGGMEKKAVQSLERNGLSNSNGVEEDAIKPVEVNEVENRDGLSEPGKAEEDWTGIVEEVQEQSKNIEAFDEVLACAEGRRVYIGNLTHTITKADLQAFFSGHGVGGITLPLNKGGKRRSYGFLNLKNAEEAERAISELSGKKLLGRVLSVKLASDHQSGQIAARKEREASAKAGGDDVPKAQSQGAAGSDKARRVSEAQVENALRKMEQWCDLWLSGRIGEDQWNTFEDCLGLF